MNPGIKQYLELGNIYPKYLDNKESRIANPGVSYFSITVGSIAKENFEDDDYIAIAGFDHVSPFSRTGLVYPLFRSCGKTGLAGNHL